MLVLPIPLVVSLAIAFLLARSLLRRDRAPLFSALLALCAAQGVVVSLAQHYGVAAMRPVQPVTATLLPPLAWVTFMATAVRGLRPVRDALHLAVPALTGLALATAPGLLDLWIPLVFAGYGGAMMLRLRDGDALALTRLEAGGQPARVWAGVALALLVSALSDALIAGAIAAGFGGLRLPLVSVFTALTLGLVAALALAESLAGRAAPDAQAPEAASAPPDEPSGSSAEDAARHGAIMAAVEAGMAGAKPYLDPDLTLDRLARRLKIPARDISRAINATTGDNASRYVNGFRVRHACGLLAGGASVTEAMLASGFNTKSNFNREFRRGTGLSPTEWLVGRGPG